LSKKKWWYEEPLHEYANCEAPIEIGELEGNYIWHARSEGCRVNSCKDDVEKFTKDYLLLKKYLLAEPSSGRKQFYAAQSAFDAKMYSLAEQEYLIRARMEGWYEETFYSWYKIGICREALEKSESEISEAYLNAYNICPDRLEPLYKLSCYYRKINKPNVAFVYATCGINLKFPDGKLFIEGDHYLWGILDEVCVTSYYSNHPEMGIAACKKLLESKYLPQEHKLRVENNLKEYYIKYPHIK
jgi:hypothetical protein